MESMEESPLEDPPGGVATAIIIFNIGFVCLSVRTLVDPCFGKAEPVEVGLWTIQFQSLAVSWGWVSHAKSRNLFFNVFQRPGVE